MNMKQVVSTRKSIATGFLLLALSLTPLSAFAAEMTTSTAVSGSELSGTLNSTNNRHYLGLDPNEREGEITLTLVFGPQSDGRVAKKVNFWVLTQSALESTLDGTVRYSAVDLAAGSPISGKNDDYKVQTTFKAAGRDHYTVVVENHAGVDANYTLTAKNGTLSDGSGQTTTSSVVQTTESAASASASAPEVETTASPIMDSKNVAAAIGGQEQRYYTVIPVDNDEDVSITFDYNPKDNSQLDGKLNFFVFDKNGLRQLESGQSAETVNLAAGNVVKSGESKLSVQFRAVGKQSYVVMVLNRSNIPATFTLAVSGADFQ